MRKSRYSIVIICEGYNTEFFFFNTIRDKIIGGQIILDATIRIEERDSIDEKRDSKIKEQTQHKRERKPQQLRDAINPAPEPIKFTGPAPLKWVEAGIEFLKTGEYDEAWAVFDKDKHPRHPEAFELAECTIVDNKKVKIIFSSRSFEYFLLLNFERIDKDFPLTDCKYRDENKSNSESKSKSIECGTGKHPKDCYGDKCINGYARLKGYWDDSKSKQSHYPLVEPRFDFGFDNAAWLRFKSDQKFGTRPLYERNPYTNVDILIARLTGLQLKEWIELDFTVDGIEIVKLNSSSISVTNKSTTAIIIPPDSFYIAECNRSKASFGIAVCNCSKTRFGEKIFLNPNDQQTIVMPNIKPDSDYFGFIYGKKEFLFSL